MTSNLDITYAEDGSGFRIQTPYNMNNSDIPCIGISPYKEMSHWTDKMIVTYEATITDEAALSTDLKIHSVLQQQKYKRRFDQGR